MVEQKNQSVTPPVSKQRDDDLYAQIAAGDQEEEKKSAGEVVLRYEFYD